MAAEISDDIKDINNSAAHKVLEELQRDGSISIAEMELYKSKYAKLHEFVLTTNDNQKNFLARAKTLNHRLVSERVKLEKTQLESQKDQTDIQQLNDQLLEIQNEMEMVSERDMMLSIQLSELEHEKRDKVEQLKEREIEREKAAEPMIREAREQIENLQQDIELTRTQKEKYQTQLEEYLAKNTALEKETDHNKEILKAHEGDFHKIRGDPSRIRKQAEKFESAVKALMDSHQEKQTEMDQAAEHLKDLDRQQKDKEEQRSKAQLRLQMITESHKLTEQACDDVNKKLQREKNEYNELVTTRVGLDTKLDDLNVESRQNIGELSQLQKQYDRMKRQFKKTQQAKDGVGDALGPLHQLNTDCSKQVKSQDEEMVRQKRLLDDIQGEVDLFIGAYLKQDSLEKDKKEEYESICQQMEEMQKELKNLKAEEQQWNAHFKTLASQREKLARDASTANRLSRETTDEVAMKQLEEDDLKKKHQEISQKQKEFCAMYEVVKNERNKYMTQIQKSSQHLSEMKEKLKILQNEVEILRMESAFKDKQLQKVKQDAQRLEVVHDQLQNEKTRITGKGASLNEQVEQYVIEIDKLNSIINSIEKEMVVLRRKYEQAVETRNFTGIQLIDRNDELCILWEKSNIQEKLLKKGEQAMLTKEEEIRSLKIDVKEVKRQLHVVQKKIPEVPKLIDEVMRLREQVGSVRKRTDELSLELENPKSVMRKWRGLGGEDLDLQTLRMKTQDLEERLNDKKEGLLEKELILEEVSALSDKLRQQAVDGRQGTMELSQKVNVFQSRIKDVTRKMMSTVSELSMYQATAHKLQFERDSSCERMMTARDQMGQGLPPTDTAYAEFTKMIQVEQQKVVDKQLATQRKQEEDIMNSNFTRTTAEPRVNAYIPEDEHGLPKAYGLNAPFKPTVLGSTMRHIRKPNPKPIEL
jgi:chromosome segregation ATPase